MPLKDGKLITPDEAIAANCCPECGGDLTDSSPIGHRNAHWRTQPPAGIDGDEGRKRIALLDQFIADHNIVTSDVLEARTKQKQTGAAAPEAPPHDETREQKIARLQAELDAAQHQGAN